MYEDFFGLTDQPFRLSTDPDYLFLSASHSRAFAYLKYAMCRRDGIVAITGDIGTGKSTVVSSVCAEAAPDADAIVLHQTQLDDVELLQAMMFAMGLTMVPATKAELLDTARSLLVSRHKAGRTTTLIVDDAHNLSATVLEELRMLADVEHESEPLLSLVLVGQPGLRRTLAQPGLEQLRQRIRLSYRLEPLDAGATARYVRHRLKIAGNATLEIFPPECAPLIFRFSRGVPRRINLLCDMAMTAASLGKRRTVSPQCVIEAAQELGWHTPSIAWRAAQRWQALADSDTAKRLRAVLAPAAATAPEPQWPAEHGATHQALHARAAALTERLRVASQTAADGAARTISAYAARARTAARSSALGAAAASALAWRTMSEYWRQHRPVALAASTLPILLMPLAALCIAVLAPGGNSGNAIAADTARTAIGTAQSEPDTSGGRTDGAPQATDTNASAAAFHDTVVVPAAYRTQSRTAMGPPAPEPAASDATTASAPVASAPSADGRAAAAPELSTGSLRPSTWILEQQPGAYTIQILGTYRPRNLQRFVSRHASDLELAYFTVARNERDWFVVVAGSYPTFSAARKASRELPAAIRSNGPWVRTFGDIQSAIGDTRGVGSAAQVATRELPRAGS